MRHRARLPDDVEFGVGAEQVDQPSTHDFVVIDEKDCDHGEPSGAGACGAATQDR